MWRTRAVIAMLVEQVAGLDPLTTEDDETELLAGAIRRARLVVAVDCLAILTLFLFRDFSNPFLPVNRTLETVFTFGVLAVAAHAGFRWAQMQRLRTVYRLCEDLRQRQES